jgi:DnaJ-class molecular chaperone
MFETPEIAPSGLKPVCAKCQGAGKVDGKMCPTCKGTGLAPSISTNHAEAPMTQPSDGVL